MGTRRYCAEIEAPLSPRFKMRIERAVTHAIRKPTRALPTLRRVVISTAAVLREQGFSGAQIQALFDQLVEDVVRTQALDTTSIVSGHPRWLDLTAKIATWLQSTAGPSD